MLAMQKTDYIIGAEVLYTIIVQCQCMPVPMA